MNQFEMFQAALTRRHLFGRTATGIGTAALASLLNPGLFANDPSPPAPLPEGERGEGGRGGFCASTP